MTKEENIQKGIKNIFQAVKEGNFSKISKEILKEMKAYFCSDCGKTITEAELPYHNSDHWINEIKE